MGMFEQAARLKLRFMFRGMISAEDLWDLRIEELNEIFRGLSARARMQADDSLLDEGSEDEILRLQIDIVRHIFSVKRQAAESLLKEAERRARRQKLMAILEEKQDAELHELSPDELRELIAELGE